MISSEIVVSLVVEKCGCRVEDAETLTRLTAAINNLIHRAITRDWLMRELVRAATRRAPRQPRKRVAAPTTTNNTKEAA
jgi:hypothetical protein